MIWLKIRMVRNKTVLEVLKEKHPKPKELDEEAFVDCDELQ